MENVPVTNFDEHGLGQEANNLTAINSLKGYRALRWGRNVELIITDQRTYRSEEPTDQPEAKAFANDDFPEFIPQEALEILDAGRDYNNGQAPESIRYGNAEIPNFRRNQPTQTLPGEEQKAWFLERLKKSKATWKIWGNTVATLEMRADPQNLPAGLTVPWPGNGYACFAQGDHSTAFVERGEIYDFVRDNGITGFVTVAGDRHSFWAGLAAKSLPPKPFEPVGIAFVVGSISAPGLIEAFERVFPKQHPLRSLFLGQGPRDSRPQPTLNLLLRHGVRSCLDYARSGDIDKARALSNPDLRRTFRSWTWEATDMWCFTSPAPGAIRNLFASHVRSSAATAPTEGLCSTGSNIERAFGATPKGPSWNWRLSRAIRVSRSN